MGEQLFDPVAFALRVRLRMAERNLMLSEAARESAVDKSILCRICRHNKPPSVENYLRLQKWLATHE